MPLTGDEPAAFEVVDGTPRLLGSRCRACSEYHFPRTGFCGRCGATGPVPVVLSSAGTLWSWTIQGFPPKGPPFAGPAGEEFVPYGVGYVELEGQLRVEARLTENRPEALSIGMPMRLTTVSYAVDDEGNDIVTYAFEPVGGVE